MGEGERKAQMSLVDLDHALMVDGEVPVTPSNENPQATITGLQALLHQRGHTIDTLNAEVVSLRGLVSAAEAATRAAEQQVADEKAAHANDVAQIGTWLQREATSRDWCEDYDDCIEEVNPKLAVKLPTRSREYAVRVRVTYEVTRTVNEASPADAWNYVNEDWDQIDRLVRNSEPTNVVHVSTEAVED